MAGPEAGRRVTPAAGPPLPDTEVDARGLKCPLPILRAKKALAALASGQIVSVVTTDPHAADDFRAFCEQTGNALLAQWQTDGLTTHLIRRR